MTELTGVDTDLRGWRLHGDRGRQGRLGDHVGGESLCRRAVVGGGGAEQLLLGPPAEVRLSVVETGPRRATVTGAS